MPKLSKIDFYSVNYCSSTVGFIYAMFLMSLYRMYAGGCMANPGTCIVTDYISTLTVTIMLLTQDKLPMSPSCLCL